MKEAGASAKTADLARRHGMSEVTICYWNSKYDGPRCPMPRQLKKLKGENAKLKRLLADVMLDQAALKETRRKP